MFSKIKKLAVTGIITSMLISNIGIIAYASAPTITTAPATATVTGKPDVTIGKLELTEFATVELDGTTKTTNATITNMKLTDARGTGNGWSVSLGATHFTNATSKNPDINTLPADSLALGKVSIAVDNESKDSTPVTNIKILEGTIDNVAGVKILDAPVNNGMGKYTISIAPLTLTLLPKDAKAGIYTSTVTMTLAHGPVI